MASSAGGSDGAGGGAGAGDSGGAGGVEASWGRPANVAVNPSPAAAAAAAGTGSDASDAAAATSAGAGVGAGAGEGGGAEVAGAGTASGGGGGAAGAAAAVAAAAPTPAPTPAPAPAPPPKREYTGFDFDVDVAICIDVTSGMQPFIDGLAKGLQEAFVDYASSVLRVKPRLAVVTFSDHDVDHGSDGKAADGAHSHSSCATVVTDFTHDIEAVAKQLGSISATADTDYPECVACGTAELPGLSWGYDALRVAVLIGDAPPHGVLGKTAFASKDRFPDGCPLGHDMVKTGTELEKNRVQKYEIHVEPDATMANDAVKKAFKAFVNCDMPNRRIAVDLDGASAMANMVATCATAALCELQMDFLNTPSMEYRNDRNSAAANFCRFYNKKTIWRLKLLPNGTQVPVPYLLDAADAFAYLDNGRAHTRRISNAYDLPSPPWAPW